MAQCGHNFVVVVFSLSLGINELLAKVNLGVQHNFTVVGLDVAPQLLVWVSSQTNKKVQ